MSKIKNTKEDGNEPLIKGRSEFYCWKETETGELLLEGKLTTHYI